MLLTATEAERSERVNGIDNALSIVAVVGDALGDGLVGDLAVGVGLVAGEGLVMGDAAESSRKVSARSGSRCFMELGFFQLVSLVNGL